MTEATPTPLTGRIVAITRPRDRAAALVEAFSDAGAEAILIPVLRLIEVEGNEATAFEETVRTFVEGGAGWFVFTSASSVAPVARLLASDPALADACDGHVRVAAVGEATAGALASSSVICDGRPLALVGDGGGAAGLVEALLAIDPAPRVLHVTSDRGLPVVVDRVEEAGGEAHRAVAVVHAVEPTLDAARLFEDPAAECVTFASPSAAEGLLAACSPEERTRVLALPAIAIGATTAEALRTLGFSTVVPAAEPTPHASVEAVAAHFAPPS